MSIGQDSSEIDNHNLIKISGDESEETQESFNGDSKIRRIKKARKIEDGGYVHNPLIRKQMIKVKKNVINAHKFRAGGSSKNKICLKIFSEFKAKNSNYYNEFPGLNKIYKNIQHNNYGSHNELAKQIRELLSNYFHTSSSLPEQYNKLIIISESFELIYKDYEDKEFLRESKNLLEMKKRGNQIQKEFREVYGNAQNAQTTPINNKMKNQCNDKKEKSLLRIKKIQGANNIHKLSIEQKKGGVKVGNVNKIDKHGNDSMLEIDINKIGNTQLKELEKYIRECLSDNNGTNSVTLSQVSSPRSTMNIIKEKPIAPSQGYKRDEIMEDLSESISSGDSDISD